MTLRERIEALLGAAVQPDAALEQWMKTGARLVVQALPESLLWAVSVEGDDAGLGLSIGTAKVLYAHVNGRRAALVAAARKAEFSDPASINRASDFAPVFYLEHGKAFVLGSAPGGTVVYAAYPSPALTDSTVAGFPEDLDQLVVLFAASMHRTADGLQLSVPQVGAVPAPPVAPELSSPVISIPAFAAPAAPVLPDAPAGVDITLPAIGTAYAAPVISLPAAPVIAALDLSGIVVPAAPSAPSIAFTDAVATSPAATAIAALPTAPVYVSPGPLSLDFSDFDNYAGGAGLEDPEMAGVFLGKIQAESGAFAARMQDALNGFNEEMEAYRAGVQRSVEQARLSAQEAAQKASLSTDVAKFNEAQSLQAAVQSYEASVRRFDGQLQLYQAQVGSAVQLYQTNNIQVSMAIWQAKAAQALQQYGVAVESARAASVDVLGRYQAQADSLVKEAQVESGVDLGLFQAEVQSALDSYRALLEAAVQTFQAGLAGQRTLLEEAQAENQSASALFAVEAQLYQTSSAARAQNYQADLAAWEAQRRTYAEDAARLMALFHEGLQVFLHVNGGQQ